MLFNSFEFAIFLPVVAYVFYGWWDWRFLFLIAFSSALDFMIGIQLSKIEVKKYRRLFFGLSCLVNLGFLGFFKYFNFFVDSFVVSGFWHGANWTFIGWGLLNGLYFLPLLLTASNRKHTDTIARGRFFPTITELAQMCVTCILVDIGWILFRSKNISEAFKYIARLRSPSLFTFPKDFDLTLILSMIAILIVVEWIQREKQHGLQIDTIRQRPVRWLIYQCIILIILLQRKINTTMYLSWVYPTREIYRDIKITSAWNLSRGSESSTSAGQATFNSTTISSTSSRLNGSFLFQNHWTRRREIATLLIEPGSKRE